MFFGFVMFGNCVRLAYAVGLTHFKEVVCAKMNREILVVCMIFLL